MNKTLIVDESSFQKIIVLFCCCVAVAIIIYLIIGLFISNIETNFVSNPVPLDQLKQKTEEAHNFSLILDNMRALAIFLIFPMFTIFAANPIFQFTKSYFLRALLLFTFAFFPVILLFVIFLVIVLTGGFHLF